MLEALKEVRAIEVSVGEPAAWKLMRLAADAKRVLAAAGIKDVGRRLDEWCQGAPHYE